VNNKVPSNLKIYALSIVHIFRIIVMGSMWFFPILFCFISGYFLFNAEWINFAKYMVLAVAIHYSYPIVLSWFEDERMKFKQQVDVWTEYHNNTNR
jgi:hypothetical protein